MGKSEIFLLLLAIGKFSSSFFFLPLKQHQQNYVFPLHPNPGEMKERKRENIFAQILKNT